MYIATLCNVRCNARVCESLIKQNAKQQDYTHKYGTQRSFYIQLLGLAFQVDGDAPVRHLLHFVHAALGLLAQGHTAKEHLVGGLALAAG